MFQVTEKSNMKVRNCLISEKNFDKCLNKIYLATKIKDYPSYQIKT